MYISLTGVVYDGNQKQLAKVKNQLRPLIASQNASDRCTLTTILTRSSGHRQVEKTGESRAEQIEEPETTWIRWIHF